MAWTSPSFEPKWYWTAELLAFPASTLIWRSDTASIPCTANNRSAVRISCSLVAAGIGDLGSPRSDVAARS